ncbi:MAG: hypothetical protein ACE5HU_03715 [Acidobacteriota bacterium]
MRPSLTVCPSATVPSWQLRQSFEVPVGCERGVATVRVVLEYVA